MSTFTSTINSKELNFDSIHLNPKSLNQVTETSLEKISRLLQICQTSYKESVLAKAVENTNKRLYQLSNLPNKGDHKDLINRLVRRVENLEFLVNCVNKNEYEVVSIKGWGDGCQHKEKYGSGFSEYDTFLLVNSDGKELTIKLDSSLELHTNLNIIPEAIKSNCNVLSGHGHLFEGDVIAETNEILKVKSFTYNEKLFKQFHDFVSNTTYVTPSILDSPRGAGVDLDSARRNVDHDSESIALVNKYRPHAENLFKNNQDNPLNHFIVGLLKELDSVNKDLKNDNNLSVYSDMTECFHVDFPPTFKVGLEQKDSDNMPSLVKQKRNLLKILDEIIPTPLGDLYEIKENDSKKTGNPLNFTPTSQNDVSENNKNNVLLHYKKSMSLLSIEKRVTGARYWEVGSKKGDSTLAPLRVGSKLNLVGGDSLIEQYVHDSFSDKTLEALSDDNKYFEFPKIKNQVISKMGKEPLYFYFQRMPMNQVVDRKSAPIKLMSVLVNAANDYKTLQYPDDYYIEPIIAQKILKQFHTADNDLINDFCGSTKNYYEKVYQRVFEKSNNFKGLLEEEKEKDAIIDHVTRLFKQVAAYTEVTEKLGLCCPHCTGLDQCYSDIPLTINPKINKDLRDSGTSRFSSKDFLIDLKLKGVQDDGKIVEQDVKFPFLVNIKNYIEELNDSGYFSVAKLDSILLQLDRYHQKLNAYQPENSAFKLAMLIDYMLNFCVLLESYNQENYSELTNIISRTKNDLVQASKTFVDYYSYELLKPHQKSCGTSCRENPGHARNYQSRFYIAQLLQNVLEVTGESKDREEISKFVKKYSKFNFPEDKELDSLYTDYRKTTADPISDIMDVKIPFEEQLENLFRPIDVVMMVGMLGVGKTTVLNTVIHREFEISSIIENDPNAKADKNTVLDNNKFRVIQDPKGIYFIEDISTGEKFNLTNNKFNFKEKIYSVKFENNPKVGKKFIQVKAKADSYEKRYLGSLNNDAVAHQDGGDVNQNEFLIVADKSVFDSLLKGESTQFKEAVSFTKVKSDGADESVAGCICCKDRDIALQLIAKFNRLGNNKVDVLFIEPTGIADTGIAHMFLNPFGRMFVGQLYNVVDPADDTWQKIYQIVEHSKPPISGPFDPNINKKSLTFKSLNEAIEIVDEIINIFETLGETNCIEKWNEINFKQLKSYSNQKKQYKNYIDDINHLEDLLHKIIPDDESKKQTLKDKLELFKLYMLELNQMPLTTEIMINNRASSTKKVTSDQLRRIWNFANFGIDFKDLKITQKNYSIEEMSINLDNNDLTITDIAHFAEYYDETGDLPDNFEAKLITASNQDITNLLENSAYKDLLPMILRLKGRTNDKIFNIRGTGTSQTVNVETIKMNL